MDKPYIIWTLRRTGGTALATLFSQFSSHVDVQHEPFNRHRIYGQIVNEWKQSFDVGRLRERISFLLDGKPVIKHCYETMPLQLNSILIQESHKRGYEQIVLGRRNEINRMLSLKIADLTGAWGPKQAARVFDEISTGERKAPILPLEVSVSHMADCFLRSVWLTRTIKSLAGGYSEIFFEDLFSDPECGKGEINKILARLGHPPHRILEYQHQVEAALRVQGQGQGRKEIKNYIPNYAQWRAIMQSNWDSITCADNKVERIQDSS